MASLVKSEPASNCATSRRRRAQAVVASVSTTGGVAFGSAGTTVENWVGGMHLTVVGVETTTVEVAIIVYKIIKRNKMNESKCQSNLIYKLTTHSGGGEGSEIRQGAGQ